MQHPSEPGPAPNLSQDGVYRRLYGEQFRLLAILPAADSWEEIECRLDVHNLATAPAYEALSYVWGGLADRYNITVDGHVFSVGDNLFSALRRLRRPDGERLIWIDAICINQEDVPEKSSQVQRMGQIYSLAVRTVAWLGPGLGYHDDVNLAFRVAEAVADICWAFAQGQGNTLWGLMDEYRSQLPVEQMELDVRSRYAGSPIVLGSAETWWKALESIFAKSWFERIWCVQEVALAKTTSIVSGNLSIRAIALGICATWIAGQILHTGQRLISMEWFSNLISCRMRCGALHYRLRAGFDGKHTLVKLLDDCRALQATNAKDKVYALLGVYQKLGPGSSGYGKVVAKSDQPDALTTHHSNAQVTRSLSDASPSSWLDEQAAKETDLPIVVDYGRSLDLVYLDVAAACTSMLGNLDILSYVEHWHELLQPGSDFPSWVPRWDRQTFSIAIDRFPPFHHWKASGVDLDKDTEPQRFRVHGRSLVVQGFIVGRVTRTGAVITRTSIASCLVESWNDVIGVTSDGSLIDAAESETKMPVLIHQGKRSYPPEPAAVSRLTRVWGLGADEARLMWIDELDDEALVPLFAFFLWAVESAQRTSKTECLVKPRDVAARIDVVPTAGDVTSEEFWTFLFFNRTFGRRIFWLTGSQMQSTGWPTGTTSDSYAAGIEYGMGPAASEAGDVVAILHGASVPYLLRPDGDEWLLVGQCYVEGLMRGELFEKGSSEPMRAEQYEPREFVLH